jgi:hypothetical protein
MPSTPSSTAPVPRRDGCGRFGDKESFSEYLTRRATTIARTETARTASVVLRRLQPPQYVCHSRLTGRRTMAKRAQRRGKATATFFGLIAERPPEAQVLSRKAMKSDWPDPSDLTPNASNYVAGMTEAKRIARKQMWVKCKDTIERGRQVWQHVDVLREAEALGMTARDLFILLPKGAMFMGRWSSQHHARKVHSYLWVFEVTDG